MARQGLILTFSALAACNDAGGSPKLKLVPSGADNGDCPATIDGKPFDPRDMSALQAALKPYADRQAEVHVLGRGNVPDRCIGGVIYTMRRQGFGKIGFIAEPPPPTSKP